MTKEITFIQNKILSFLHSNSDQLKQSLKVSLQPIPYKIKDTDLVEFLQFVLQITPQNLFSSFVSLNETFNNIIHILSLYFNYFVTQIHVAMTSSEIRTDDVAKNEIELKILPIQIVFKNLYHHIKYLFVANVKDFLDSNNIDYSFNEECVHLLNNIQNNIQNNVMNNLNDFNNFGNFVLLQNSLPNEIGNQNEKNMLMMSGGVNYDVLSQQGSAGVTPQIHNNFNTLNNMNNINNINNQNNQMNLNNLNNINNNLNNVNNFTMPINPIEQPTMNSLQNSFQSSFPNTLQTSLQNSLQSSLQNSLQNSSKKTQRIFLDKKTKTILKQWFTQHENYPYPSDIEKAQLAVQCNISMKQLNTWFANYRSRYKKKYC